MQRFKFPTDWLYYDNVEGEWSAFQEIYARKMHALEGQIPSLRQKIKAEDSLLEAKIKELIAEWAENKPVEGIDPQEAEERLRTFEKRIGRMREDYTRLQKAKEALDLDSGGKDLLQPVEEELKDLQGVYSSLQGIVQGINEMRDTPWAAVVPRKIRQELEKLLADLKEMPPAMKSYSAYESVTNQIRGLLKVNYLLIELRSEALKPRHWEIISKRMKMSFVVNDMTLGSIWDADIVQHEAAVKEIILQAQGELGLEQFIKQTAEFWKEYSLDLVMYQKKTHLVRGWDVMFDKLNENLNSFASMKQSPYYKVFLGQLHMLL